MQIDVFFKIFLNTSNFLIDIHNAVDDVEDCYFLYKGKAEKDFDSEWEKRLI